MAKLEEIITKRDYHAKELEYWNRFITDYQEINAVAVSPLKGRKIGKHKGTVKLERQARKLYKGGMHRKDIAVEIGRSPVTVDNYLRGVKMPVVELCPPGKAYGYVPATMKETIRARPVIEAEDTEEILMPKTYDEKQALLGNL